MSHKLQLGLVYNRSVAKWFVYILQCKDKSLYTGITNDLQKRLSDHRAGGGSKYVRSRLPVRIVHKENCRTKSKALKREAGIKRLTRQQKLKLIK